MDIQHDDSLDKKVQTEIQETINDYLLSKNLNANCSIIDKTFLSFRCKNERGTLKKIRQENIIYIEKIRHKVILYTHLGNFEFYSSLKKLEEKLNPTMFYRVHQGYIVNIREIKMLYSSELSLLSCDRIIPVSRRKSIKLKKELVYS